MCVGDFVRQPRALTGRVKKDRKNMGSSFGNMPVYLDFVMLVCNREPDMNWSMFCWGGVLLGAVGLDPTTWVAMGTDGPATARSKRAG